jgi:hypothetical protein
MKEFPACSPDTLEEKITIVKNIHDLTEFDEEMGSTTTIRLKAQ